MKRIANNTDEFISRVGVVLTDALNTDAGMDLLKMGVRLQAAKGQELDVDAVKKDVALFVFYSALKENKSLMDEFAYHIYNDIRKEA